MNRLFGAGIGFGFILFSIIFIPVIFDSVESSAAIPPTPAFKTIVANGTTDVTADKYNDTINFTSSNYSIVINGTDGILQQTFSDWDYSKSVTVNSTKVAADATDFPMLISITDTDLRDNAQADGDDILFATSDGTQLSHEIEKYNSTSGELVAWVRTDLSGSVDTEFDMYYGNGAATNQEDVTGTWNSNYIAVYHLHDDFLDSTSYNNDGTNSGSSDLAGEYIADSQDFDGLNDYISLGDPTALSYPVTLQSWLKPDDVTISSHTVSTGQLGLPYRGWTFLSANPGVISLHVGDGTGATIFDRRSATGDIVLIEDEWSMIHVASRGATDASIYVNGTDDGTLSYSGSGGAPNNGGLGYIGTNDASGFFADAGIDEVRIHQGELSQNWITTEWNNQNSPSTFYTMGTHGANSAASEYTTNIIDFVINEPTSSVLGGVLAETCPAGDFVSGIFTNGSLICTTP
jgi:hypothetical protein